MSSRYIFVISGPSGVGKTSVVSELLRVRSGITQVLSFTTRGIRSNEIDGEHYHFITKDVFNAMLARGDFVESTEIFGNMYGISKSCILNILETKHALLVPNWQGYLELKKAFGNRVIGVFLMPPSFNILRERLTHRSTDSEEEIERRMARAHEDMSKCDLYDYKLINHTIYDTVYELAKIFDNVR